MNGASQRCRWCANPFPQCSHQWEATGARSSRHAGKGFRILKDFTFHRFQRIHVVVDPSPRFLHEAVGLFVLPDLRSLRVPSVGSICVPCLEELISRNTRYNVWQKKIIN